MAETKRVEFTIAQYRLLRPILRRLGLRESHIVEADAWNLGNLRQAIEKLPVKTTRQYITRESMLKRIEGAK